MSSKAPLISVVMPVYNSAKTVRRSIDSIICQTFDDFEFIIVNEGASNDGTTEILEEYANIDKRIKIIQTEGKIGIAPSLNKGLDAARGKYIARMDADDYSYPKRFQKQVEFMEKNPDITVCGTGMKVYYNEDKWSEWRGYTDPDLIAAESLFSCPISHPTVFIRRENLEKYGFRYSEKKINVIPEDYELWLRMLEKGLIFSNIDEVLLDYNNDDNFHLSHIRNPEKNTVDYEIIKKHFYTVLKVDISDYPDEIFYSVCSIEEIIESDNFQLEYVYDLITIIEKNNAEYGVFDKDKLGEVLVAFWDRCVSRFYINKGLDKISMRCGLLIGDDLHNRKEYPGFTTTLSEKNGINPDKLRNEIVCGIRILKELAGDIHDVIIFGRGRVVKRYIPFLSRMVNIIAYSDNQAIGTEEFYGSPVIKPSQIYRYDFDHILIGSNKYYDVIEKQLVEECGIDKEKILPLELIKFKKERY